VYLCSDQMSAKVVPQRREAKRSPHYLKLLLEAGTVGLGANLTSSSSLHK